MRLYLLDESGDPVLEKDTVKWAILYGKRSNKIVHSGIAGNYKEDDVTISTVFLGLDHSTDEGGEPMIFETMVFGGKHDGLCQRYSTPGQARTGHYELYETIAKELKGS